MVNKGITGIPEILTTYYGETDLGNPFEYRPITRITFALERSLWGEVLWASHLINVLLYGLLVFVVIQFLVTLLGEKYRNLILLSGLIFLFHPVHSEVVCSLKNRDEILSLLFALWSSMLLLRFIDRKSWLVLLAASLLFVLSMATKPGQLPLAGILVLGLWLFQKRPIKNLLWAGIPFFVITAIYLGVVTNVFPQWWRLDYAYEENSLYFHSLSERLPTAFVALFHNFRLLVWPEPLTFFYGYDHISLAAWSDATVIGAIILLISLTVAFFMTMKKAPIIAFSIGVFIMAISPFLNVIGAVAGIIAERWLLTASLGFCLVLAYLLQGLMRSPKLRVVGLSILTLVLGLDSYQVLSRIPDWRSHRTLVYRDVQTVPRSFVPNFMAALYYQEDADAAPSPKERETALRNALACNEMLVDICKKKSRYMRRCAEQGQALNDRSIAVKYGLQLFDSAGNDFENVMVTLPILLQFNEAENGIRVAQQAASMHPQQYEPIAYLGNFLLMKKDTTAAISAYESALSYPNAEPGLVDHVSRLKASFNSDQ